MRRRHASMMVAAPRLFASGSVIAWARLQRGGTKQRSHGYRGCPRPAGVWRHFMGKGLRHLAAARVLDCHLAGRHRDTVPEWLLIMLPCGPFPAAILRPEAAPMKARS